MQFVVSITIGDTTCVKCIVTKLGWQILERHNLQSQLSILCKINHNVVRIDVAPNLHVPTPQSDQNDKPNKFVQCHTNLLASPIHAPPESGTSSNQTTHKTMFLSLSGFQTITESSDVIPQPTLGASFKPF